jgi:hypothetical protein
MELSMLNDEGHIEYFRTTLRLNKLDSFGQVTEEGDVQDGLYIKRGKQM